MKRKKSPDRIIYAAVVILLLIGLFFIWKKPRFNFISSFTCGFQKKMSDFISYTGYAFSSSAKKSLKVISEKNMQLEAESQVLTAESDRLRKMVVLRSVRDFKSSVICYAFVIGSNDDGLIYFYTIDRGSDDGISEGDGAINSEGAVGRVFKVTGTTAQVQLLTDVKSAVSARDARSRVTGILSGESYNKCSINYIPREEDVKEGDNIVTSGLGKSFPEGVRIGTVIKADKKVDSLSMVVKVKPAVNMMTVEEVLIIRKK